MPRSFIPFILVSLGFTMILLTDTMPLFEWELSEIATDFSPNCGRKLSSYWITYPGESLDDRGGSENLKIVVRRSWNDETLEHVSHALFGSWLFEWSLIEVILSITYIWWLLLRDKQDRASHFVMAVFSTGIAILVCLFLSQLVRLVGPLIHWLPYYSLEDCHGTITFSAKLLKIHYETSAIRFTGVLMELGAIGVMVRQIINVVMQRKESLKLAVG